MDLEIQHFELLFFKIFPHLCTPAELLHHSLSKRRLCRPLLPSLPCCLWPDPNSHKKQNLDTKQKQEKHNFNIKKDFFSEDIVMQGCLPVPLCLEKVRSLSSGSSSASISSSVSHPSSSPAFAGSSKSTSPKSSATSSDEETPWESPKPQG